MTPQSGGKNSKNITVWVLDVLGNEWPIHTSTDDDVIGVLMRSCLCPTLRHAATWPRLRHAAIVFDCHVVTSEKLAFLVLLVLLCVCVYALSHTHEQACILVCVHMQCV